MILHALNKYYERLRDDPQIDIPGYGFGKQGVHFCLTLDSHGNLVGKPLDLRDERGRARRIEVPGPVERSSDVLSNFAWDNTGYVLGADNKGKPKRTALTHAAFKERAAAVLDGVKDEGATALLAFLEQWRPEQAESLPDWESIIGQNIVFQLDGEAGFLHDRPAFREAWSGHLEANGSSEAGMCLVTGETAPIPLTHAKIKGVPGAALGASLVSFNFDAAISYGKKQNLNAPISERAAFAYTTALNHLLAQDSPRKVQIGDTTVVFWSETPGEADNLFNMSIGGKKAEDENLTRRLESYLSTLANGKYPEELGRANTPFYVLGLSLNVVRLSVRFWHVGTVGDMAENLGEYFRNQELAHDYPFTKYPPIKSLIYALAPLRKEQETGKYKAMERSESTSKRCTKIVNELLLRMLKGGQYPGQLVNLILERIRNDHCIEGFNGIVRLSFLKAYLIKSGMEVTMGLNNSSMDYGYLLGRLFAVVEKIQHEANDNLNTTIRDRYFSGAMSAPSRVFVPLIQNAFDNLPKVRKNKGGLSGYFEKLLNDIFYKIEVNDGFKHSLSLHEQAQFILGYFHQRTFKNEDSKES